MRVTFLGHAGLFVETAGGSVLCDPWFHPAYFASWFPFPSNESIDRALIARPDYLYLSHLHRDHFDARFLAEEVSKETVVLLPDYPLDLMRRELEKLGFHRFHATANGRPLQLEGLTVSIPALVAPTDGPLGDSGLVLDDGRVRIYDQNDSRPVDLDLLASLGPFDLHFLQFSGAIWYPFVYQFPPEMHRALGRKKRVNEMARATRYIREIGAAHVVPSAGPPCFLSDELFELNDFERDPANTFPDQAAFLDHLAEEGIANAVLALPGTVIEVEPGNVTVTHALCDEEISEIFENKRAYLHAYKRRRQPDIDVRLSALDGPGLDLVAELKPWFEPLLAAADITCAGVGGVVVLDTQPDPVAIDFDRRVVERWTGQEWRYIFHLDRRLVEHCVREHLEDWVNELFLSCRFSAERKGPFNEYVYNFFKCLSMERLQYAEGYYADRMPVDQFWESAGYRIQRRCPHLKADLARFATIEDGVLTCSLHGWQFDLATGRCLTSDDRQIYARRLEDPVAEAVTAVVPRPAEDVGAKVRDQCGHCQYLPARLRSGTGG